MAITLLQVGLAIAAAGQVGASANELSPRRPLSKIEHLSVPAGPHRLVVKFVDELKVRIDKGAIHCASSRSVTGIQALVARFGVNLERHLDLPEDQIDRLERRAAEHSGIEQPDLGGMYHVAMDDDNKLLELAKALNDMPETEWVFFQETALPTPPCFDIAPPTLSYVSSQGYAGPDPGVNMIAARDLGNAWGAGINIADCEIAFNQSHEDLCGVSIEDGQALDVSMDANVNHGTATVGEMVALANAYGTTGLVPSANLQFFPEWNSGHARRAESIAAACGAVDAGEIVVLEMQTTNGVPGYPFIAAETEHDVFMTVKNCTDAGIVVVGAAGNGFGNGASSGGNLDDPAYAAYQSWGDSGAIIVGAGTADKKHDQLTYSTYGSRVNLQGWGQNVFTLGYNDRTPLNGDPNQRYTNTFAGTSSATPIVASCCAAIEALAIEQWGYTLSPRNLRELLIITGVPQGAGNHIGPLPDVVAAANDLEPSTWVDFNYVDDHDGSFERPYDSIDLAQVHMQPDALMRIKAGSSLTPVSLSAPVRIQGWNGIVTIGE